MANDNYYILLDVDESASEDEIKRAYRKVALKYHPDRNPGEEAKERFRMAAEAYEVLRDPEKRQLYDTYGKAGLERNGFAGFDDMGDMFSNLGSVFGDIFGFGRRRQKHPRGQNIQSNVNLNLREAATGVDRDVAIQRPSPCNDCNATGAHTPEDIQTCPDCRGSGQISHSQGFMMISTTCMACGGEGRHIVNNCKVCDGNTYIMQPDMLKVHVPAGINHGEQLRVSGAGGIGPGAPGDLYIEVNIEKDPDLIRRGDDVYTMIEIDMAEAALGTEVTVRGLVDDINVTIPPGTQPNETLSAANKGMPRRTGRGRGSHIVHVNVSVPQKLNQDQRRHLNEYLKSIHAKKTG